MANASLREMKHTLFFIGCVIILFKIATTLEGRAEPLRVHRSNPRYLTDGSGKAIYLTGSHNWWDLSDGGHTDPPPAFDYTAYLDFLRSRNHNFIRMWRFEVTKYRPRGSTSDIYVAPNPWVRAGPEMALDGKPKFDLTQFNQAYFDRLRSRVIAAHDRGIYVSIMLFGGAEQYIDCNPMHRNNNINGINGDPNGDGLGIEIQTLPLPAGVGAIQKAYVRKVIDTVNDLDNILYEIVNEAGTYSTSWQYDLINYIKSYEAGKPKQHPVGMTWQWSRSSGQGSNTVLFNSPAEWISPGGVEPAYKTDPPAATGAKVIVTDTDHLWGEGGNADWVWKSFLRGLNPIYMDRLAEITGHNGGDIPGAGEVRKAMGYIQSFAVRMNLAAMTPRSDLASTEYCLANLGREYLVYLPPRRRHSIPLVGSLFKSAVTVDLSGAPTTLDVEWFNPRTGETFAAESVTGGASSTFTAPFGGEAVLYLKSR